MADPLWRYGSKIRRPRDRADGPHFVAILDCDCQDPPGKRPRRDRLHLGPGLLDRRRGVFSHDPRQGGDGTARPHVQDLSLRDRSRRDRHRVCTGDPLPKDDRPIEWATTRVNIWITAMRIKIDHDFSKYKEVTVARRVQRRMQVPRSPSYRPISNGCERPERS